MEAIPLKSVIATYFFTKNENKVDFENISKFKKNLENKFNFSVYIDFSNDSLINIANEGEFEINFKNETIIYKGRNLKSEMKKYFIPCIPHCIRENYLFFTGIINEN